MNTEFYSLQLSKLEALECLRALLLQALIDDEIRERKGLEIGEINPMISQLVKILQKTDDEVERETDRAVNDLWEYSWYAFTSEWAWYRAQQEALRQLKKKARKVDLSGSAYRASAEKNFKRFFVKYVSELNMKPIFIAKQRSSKKPNDSLSA